MTAGINPTLHTAGLAALETVVNKALQLAPGANSEMAALDGCIFALHCSSPPFQVYLQPGTADIRLLGYCEDKVTTRVSGTASDFAELASADDPAATLINGNLEIEGDSAPLIELQQVLAGLDVDWEAPLVNALGDVAGHQLAKILRGVFQWGQQASSSLSRQLDEFIHEEARLSPPRLELEDFYSDVQSLKLQLERLESRSQRLNRRLTRIKG
jgi:ubiquinone biosynthesis protein UbiJ